VNLPNTLTAGRIAITPFIAVLPFIESWTVRFIAWGLFTVAAVSDYYDGVLARSWNQITDLGKMLDPLADKLLLVGTFAPMFWLSSALPFRTPLGSVGLPWWIVAVVLGREAFMTVFRQAAARRGLVIAAIGPAKWKTTFQMLWQGAAYFWFWIASLATTRRWDNAAWHAFANFNGICGTVAMTAAVLLTIYSFVLYVQRYGAILLPRSYRKRVTG
jgi:CDP-diacylglycerol--glycerol-3-phosphate 3-phosphatidyltransferase